MLVTFVRFGLVWFCLFLLPLGVWDGLWFVIVALPGLFSHLFLMFHLIKPGVWLAVAFIQSIWVFHDSYIGDINPQVLCTK